MRVFWKVTRCVETAAVAETCCADNDPGVTPTCAQVGRATGCCALARVSGIMAYDQADRPLSPASDASDLFEAQEQAAEAMKQQLVKAATIALHCKQYSSHTRLKVRACDVGMAPAAADNPPPTPNKQGAVRTDYRTRKARGAPQTRYCSACARVDTERNAGLDRLLPPLCRTPPMSRASVGLATHKAPPRLKRPHYGRARKKGVAPPPAPILKTFHPTAADHSVGFGTLQDIMGMDVGNSGGAIPAEKPSGTQADSARRSVRQKDPRPKPTTGKRTRCVPMRVKALHVDAAQLLKCVLAQPLAEIQIACAVQAASLVPDGSAS